MKYQFYNKRQLFGLLLTGVLLVPTTACQQKNKLIETPNVTEITVEPTHLDEVEPKEEVIIKKMKEFEKQVVDYLNQENFEKVKDKVVDISFTMIDFIFYDTEIDGIRFKELPEKSKYEVVKIWANVDDMIEQKFPNYKDNIVKYGKETSQTLTEKASGLVQYLEDKLEATIGKEKMEELKENCLKASKTVQKGLHFAIEKGKEGYQKIEEEHGEEIKDAYTRGKTYVKEKIHDLSNWYQDQKEKYGKE